MSSVTMTAGRLGASGRRWPCRRRGAPVTARRPGPASTCSAAVSVCDVSSLPRLPDSAPTPTRARTTAADQRGKPPPGGRTRSRRGGRLGDVGRRAGRTRVMPASTAVAQRGRGVDGGVVGQQGRGLAQARRPRRGRSRTRRGAARSWPARCRRARPRRKRRTARGCRSCRHLLLPVRLAAGSFRLGSGSWPCRPGGRASWPPRCACNRRSRRG